MESPVAVTQQRTSAASPRANAILESRSTEIAGCAVLLLHGITSSSQTWSKALPALAEGHTVIAPDLLGHGESAKPRGDIALPELVGRLSPAPLALIAAGGLLYTTGAIVYALRRPNPWPRVFGFHEVFHAFVIAAALAHFIAMAGRVVTA